jgi:hypothetical protein
MTQNGIELEKAHDWDNAQRGLKDKSPSVNDLKGWFVPEEDLSQVIGEGAVKSRMFYNRTRWNKYQANVSRRKCRWKEHDHRSRWLVFL